MKHYMSRHTFVDNRHHQCLWYQYVDMPHHLGHNHIPLCGCAPQSYLILEICNIIIHLYLYHYDLAVQDLKWTWSVVHRNTKAHGGVSSKVFFFIFCMFDELFPTFLESRGIMAWQLGWMTFQCYPRSHVIKWKTKIPMWLNIWISCKKMLKRLINYVVKHLHLDINVTFTWPLKVIQCQTSSNKLTCHIWHANTAKPLTLFSNTEVLLNFIASFNCLWYS